MLSRIATVLKSSKLPVFWNKRLFSSTVSHTETINDEPIPGQEQRLPKYRVTHVNYDTLIKKPKSEESMTFNRVDTPKKSLFKYTTQFLPRPYALELIQEIELYTFSKAFDEVCCPTKIVCSKFSLLSLHCWLLNYRLSQIHSISSWRMRRNLEKLLSDYVKDSVYSYQNYFDRDVYAELLRIKRTQFFALDDYFVYKYKEKPLSQIITEDILLGEYDEESPMIEHLEHYIEKHVEYLETLSAADIKNNHIYWGLNSLQDFEADQATTSPSNKK